MDAGTKPRHATTKLTPPSSYSDATATETSRRRGVPGCASKRAEIVWAGVGRGPRSANIVLVAPLSGSATRWFVLSRVRCAIRSLESPPRHVAMYTEARIGQDSYFTLYDGKRISLLGMLASSLTASSAEIKAATEKRIEPNTKSSSPTGEGTDASRSSSRLTCTTHGTQRGGRCVKFTRDAWRLAR